MTASSAQYITYISTAMVSAKQLVLNLLYYETAKELRVHSPILGTVHRLVQLAILAYVVFGLIIAEKGYQRTDQGLGAATTRVTGVARSGLPPHIQAWDITDSVVPAEENKAFFVTTRAIITDNQTQSVCAESVEVSNAHCDSDEQCLPAGKTFSTGHGTSNGTCNNISGTCFVQAWCPIADPSSPPVQLEETGNFTVLIKSHVLFPDFKVRASNVASLEPFYFNVCRYNAVTDPLCPMFRLKDMVEDAVTKKNSKLTYSDVIKDGAIIAIRVRWRCNLDYDVKLCFPTYTFDRLDPDTANSSVKQGYNYEYAHKYFQDDVEYRQHITAFGILFIIIVDAEAGKFDFLPLVANLSYSLPLLGASTVICDLFLLYCCNSKKYLYRAAKYEEVADPEADPHNHNADGLSSRDSIGYSFDDL